MIRALSVPAVLVLVVASTGVGPGCATADPSPDDGADVDRSDEDSDADSEPEPEGSGGMTVVVSGSGGMGLGGDPETGSGGRSGPVQLSDCEVTEDCKNSDPCMDVACNDGYCEKTPNDFCECKVVSAAVDCFDDNDCTIDSCVGNKCVYSDNTGSCTDDGNACSSDVCQEGVCEHPDSGLCGENTVTLRSVRDGNEEQWITLNASSQLVWNAGLGVGQATVFTQIAVTPSSFKFQDVSSGLYVVYVGEDDVLAATGDEASAAVFATPDCSGTVLGVGLQVPLDDDGQKFAAADGDGMLRLRSGGCGSGSLTAWERFAITPVSFD